MIVQSYERPPFEEVLRQYTPLIRSATYRHRTNLLLADRDDLTVAAETGLWEAWRKFEPDKKHETPQAYYTSVVYNRVIDEIRRAGGRSTVASNGNKPSYRYLLQRNSTSLDEMRRDPDSYEGERHPFDIKDEALPTENAIVYQLDATKELFVALTTLDKREYYIIRRHFFESILLREVAVELKISESRVAQLKARALQKMREELTNVDAA